MNTIEVPCGTIQRSPPDPIKKHAEVNTVDLIDFFVPNAGVGFMRPIFTIVNLVSILGGIALAAYLSALLIRIARKGPSDRPSLKDIPKRLLLVCLGFSAGVTVLLASLCLFADHDPSGVISLLSEFTAEDVLRVLLAVLSPVGPILDVRHLVSGPVPGFFGLNLIVRVVLVFSLVAAVWAVWLLAKKTAFTFGGFLSGKLRALSAQAPDSVSSAQTQSEPDPSLEGEAAPDSPTEPNEPREKNDGERTWSFLRRLFKLIPPGFGITLAAYILGTGETRESIESVLSSLQSFLELITPLSQVDPAGGSIPVLLSNFLYVLLSILTVGVYLAAILMLFIALYTVLKNWPAVISWLERHKRALLIAIGTVLLAAAAVTGLVGLAYVLHNSNMVQSILSRGPLGLLELAGYFLLLVLALCLVLTALVFLFAFAALVSAFAFSAVKDRMNAWRSNGAGPGRTVRWLVPAILAAMTAVTLILGYGELQAFLDGVFAGGQPPLQVLAKGAGFLGVLAAAIGLAATAAVLTVVLLTAAGQLLTAHRKPLGNSLAAAPRELLSSAIHVLLLVPFTVKRCAEIVKYFISSVLQIFIGYRNESEKNKAIFVAACFASLASLLNTFFGLSRFYDASGSPVLILCSFAIACAVQLAMLIFGMKAGEGLAERRMMDVPQADRGMRYTVIRKVFALSSLLLADISLVVFAVLSPGGHPLSWFPFLVLILGMLAVSCALALQVLDIIQLCKKWSAARKKREQDADRERTPPPPPETGAANPADLMLPRALRRLPFHWYLAAYLLLMVVSTGFAFNNMFGYYAQGARLQERVYDQVRFKTDDQLALEQTTAVLVQRFDDNTDALLAALTTRSAQANKVREAREAKLRDIAENEKDDLKHAARQNEVDRYIGQTRGFESVVSALQTFLEMDYDAIRSDVLIVREDFFHYWRNNPQHSYQSSCLRIYLDGKEPVSGTDGAIIVGTRSAGEPITELEISDSLKISLPKERYEDLDSADSSVSYTVTKTDGADKYTILKELFSLYDRVEQRVFNYGDEDGTQNTNKGTEAEAEAAAMSLIASPLLNQNAKLDGIRTNLAELTGTSVPSMSALPRTVSEYLNRDGGAGGAQTASPAGTPQENDSGSTVSADFSAYDPLPAYQTLSDHIDRALALYHVLLPFRYMEPDNTEDTSDQGSTSNLQESGAGAADPSYIVQQYRNYAQGMTHLNFQLSYDTLLSGGLGLNPVKFDIDALYASTAAAVFILLICLIVDFLAFFSGLFLFKEVYLFEFSGKINRIGCLNLDMTLANLFSVPEGPERMLHLAFLYTLLYGNPRKEAQLPTEPGADAASDGDIEIPAGPDADAASDEGTQPSAGRDIDAASAGEMESPAGSDADAASVGEMEFPTGSDTDAAPELEVPLDRIVRSENYRVFCRQMCSVLQSLDLRLDEDGANVDLQNWLRGFVIQNEIRFDELFSADRTGPEDGEV